MFKHNRSYLILIMYESQVVLNPLKFIKIQKSTVIYKFQLEVYLKIQNLSKMIYFVIKTLF